MKLNIKVKKTGNMFEKLTKGISDLNNEKVQSGHFEEQGEHYSGHTYPELMALHHNPEGNGFDFPPRPVLDILFHRNENLDNPQIKTILNKYRKLEPNEANNKLLLEELGKYLVKQEKEIFGSSALAPNAQSTIDQKGKNSPLVDTGSLRDKVAYKTSKDKTIKEGK